MKDKIQAGTTLKVLLHEDSQSDAELILELLKDSGYIIEANVTATKKEFESFLFRPKFDIILSDFSLPGFDAFGALNLRNDICPEIPFLCVSGSIGEETAIELLKAGAVDYILKDRLERLPFAVNRALDDAKDKLARKQAEEDLKDSLLSYKILANSGQALIWTSGKDKLCNYFNDVWLKFTGRKLEQELGSGWTEGVHPDDLQFCLNTYIEAFERREKFSMEYRVKRHDGIYRWIQDDGSPRYNIKGDFAGYIGHCLDVTDRKMAEEKLIESEEKYRLLLENSGIGVGVYSLDGDILFFNQKAIENLGGKPEDYIGKNLKDVFGEEAGTVYINRVLEAAKSATSIEYEDFVELGSGKLWFLSNHSRIKNNKGDIISVQVLAHDITERKLAENLLKGSEGKYRSIFENIQDAFYQVDLAGIVLEISPSIKNLSEFEREEIIGQPVENYYDNPSDGEILSNEIMKSGEIRDYESKFKTKTGKVKDISINAKLMFDSEGKPSHIDGAIRDITERKLAEEQIQKISNHYQALIEKAPDGIVLINTEGDFKYVSPSARKMFGYSQTDEIFGSPARFTHPEDLNYVLSNLAQIYQDPTFAPTLQYRFIDKNGNWKWVESTFTNLLGDSSVEAIVINFRDITDRKLAEEQIKASEQKFRELFENSLMGISEADLTGDLININMAYAKMYGYDSPQEMMSEVLNVAQLYAHTEERQEVLKILGDQGFMEPRQIELIKRDGTHFFAIVSAKGIKDNEDKLISYQASHIDITERKQAEETLQDIIDKNPMSIQIVDTDGYTLKTNPANIALFGAPPPPDFSIFDDIQSKSKELDELIILAKSGEVVHLPDIHYNAHDIVPSIPDNPKWIRAIIFPLKDSYGKPDRFVLMHEDITERKNAEEAIIDKATQLQRFNDLMVGREIKMVDLKREINKLYERLGETEKYVVVN
ncbi:MAG: PAS domain S-box protein [bacterium]